MKINNEKLVIYFGTYNEPKNLSQVAEDLYGDKKDSVRSSFSKKKALEEMLEENLIYAQKSDGWKYKANEDLIGDVICHLLEHKDEELNELEFTSEDFETVEQMFKNEAVERFLQNEKISNVLGKKLSEAERQLSVYIKLLYVTLAASRIVIEDIEIPKDKFISLNEESIDRLESMIKLIDFASKESSLRVGPIFEEIMKGSLNVNLMELPRTNSKTITTFADQAKTFITEVMGLEIESMIEVNENDSPAAA